MAAYRSKNRFGKRFIRLQELRDYVVDLDLSRHPPGEGLIVDGGPKMLHAPDDRSPRSTGRMSGTGSPRCIDTISRADV
jgi:hypothetical protein